MACIEDEIKQKKFTSMHQKAMLNLIFTANWVYSENQEVFKRFGITGHQYNILRILKGQYPKRITGTEIKSRLLDRNSDISRLLARLVAKKLITKNTCPNDKRAWDVGISEAGLTLLKQIKKTEKQRRVLALSEDEARTLSDLLDKARSG